MTPYNLVGGCLCFEGTRRLFLQMHMEVTGYSETLGGAYQITRCHIQKHHGLNFHRRESIVIFLQVYVRVLKSKRILSCP
jgi:hypothetical protein